MVTETHVEKVTRLRRELPPLEQPKPERCECGELFMPIGGMALYDGQVHRRARFGECDPHRRPRVELVDSGEWEAWCPQHPLANGDTGTVHATWAEAMAAVADLPCQRDLL